MGLATLKATMRTTRTAMWHVVDGGDDEQLCVLRNKSVEPNTMCRVDVTTRTYVGK